MRLLTTPSILSGFALMWFLDTGNLIALFSEKDTFHAQSLAVQTRAQHLVKLQTHAV